MDQGLDPGVTDNEGNTFWHIAASNVDKHNAAGFFEFLDTLDVEGATKPNRLGQTPLHLIAALMPGSLWKFDNFSSAAISMLNFKSSYSDIRLTEMFQQNKKNATTSRRIGEFGYFCG